MPGLAAQSGGLVVRPDRGRSWMRSGVSGSDLLYISDVATGDVYAYTYPQGTLVGTLTGFKGSLRECSDRKGNVFITNSGKQQLLEYAHGGTSPVATFADPNNLPTDCSVDPTTGNLAVTNYSTKGSHHGSLYVYRHTGGKPIVRTDPNVLAYLFCGYDNKGNLFVDGLDYSYNFMLVELPRNKGKFETIALDQAFSGWGGVQWDGNYVAVGDGASTIYRFAISGSTATEVGSVTLGGARNVVQFWIDGSTIIGPDGPNGGNKDVGLWSYPYGGTTTSTIPGFKNPSGATVSVGS